MENSKIDLKIHETIIEPPKRFSFFNFSEIWNYRGLLLFLIKRDIKIRYKQTILGGLWAIIQPVFTTIIKG